MSFKGPQEVGPCDPALAKMGPLGSTREAVLCLVLPRTLLYPLQVKRCVEALLA